MATNAPRPDLTVLADGPEAALAKRLERGEVIYFPVCPFSLFEGEDHQYLLEQRLGKGHKNVSYNPHTGRVSGFRLTGPGQGERLRGLLGRFAEAATAWLASTLPRYARGWKLDLVSYRPEEEATRRLRHKCRNDLLHVDAFPSRPTNGHRILRLFANVNLSEPRVWVTSDPFPRLLQRYGEEAGLPTPQPGLGTLFRRGLVRLFKPERQRSLYDEFMLRFHDFLKANEQFQEQCSKRFWHFQPGSAWLVITDTASHAALRGRYALEHSYFLSPETLALPEESPSALLEKACGIPVLRKAG